jgi:Zn-dependent M28 family amino/carboxypeptidase
VNVESRFYDSDGGNAYNVIAELPGSDPALRDEVVMVGAHLDSWHTGVGATDNADGTVTMMEALRILKAVGARRGERFRIALWGGEEQGLLGSRAWVAQHLAGDANAAAARQVRRLLQHRQRHRPDLRLVPAEQRRSAADLRRLARAAQADGARRNVSEPIGSTDHLAFTDVGVPGFNPIQDYVNYDIRTHHTNMDTVDRVDIKDIRQAAIVMATFVYNAANLDRKLPRVKP